MARPGLLRHRKFARLARLIGSDALAIGHLEILWSIAYEAGDAFLGDAGDVEYQARWQGADGELVAALVESGFVDLVDGGYAVHDLWDHAPRYVQRRAAGEQRRRENGRSIAEIRAEAGKKGADGRWKKASDVDEMANGRQTDGKRTANDSKRVSLPAPSTQHPAPIETPNGVSCPEPCETARPGPQPPPEHGPDPVLTIACKGKPQTWDLLPDKLSEWQELYPDLDVLAEIRHARQWLRDNPARGKTARGMPRYLGAWLERSQNRSRASPRSSPGDDRTEFDRVWKELHRDRDDHDNEPS